MGVYKTLSDGELTEKLNQQDTAALEEAYNRYWGLLYNHAVKMMNDRDKAADIVQDIFAALMGQMGSLDIKTPLEYYLYRSVKNNVIKAFYKDKNRQKYVDSLKDFANKGAYVTDETVLEREMKKRIEKVIASLPPKMREVFELSRSGHLSRREIADATNTTEGTVNTQLNRAFKILRSKLTLLIITLLTII